jgi:hypothetical protein
MTWQSVKLLCEYICATEQRANIVKMNQFSNMSLPVRKQGISQKFKAVVTARL